MGLLGSNKREQALNGRAGKFIACLAVALQRWSHFALPTQKKKWLSFDFNTLLRPYGCNKRAN